MRYINLIIAALMGALFSLTAGAQMLANDDIIEGPARNYTIADIKWEVPISATHNITVTGTIQDVVRHLQEVAPEIAEAKFPSVADSESTSVPLLFDGAVVKTTRPNKVVCDISDKKANGMRIFEGAVYLHKVHGQPGNGPNSCGQVSCSYNSAIWWCNDSPESLSLDNWGMIADGAMEVVSTRNDCRPDKHYGFSGQTFYDKWSVMVKGGSC